MTTYQLIKTLKKQGYRVSFSKRKDGGYLIKSIGKQKFTGAKGNIQARAILGVQLSKAREFQLNRINKSTAKSRTPLSKELQAKIRRVQRIWRKTHDLSKGTVKTSSIRYQLETYGEEEAWNKLEKAERYALGYAYYENINFALDRLKSLLKNIDEEDYTDDIKEVLKKLDEDNIDFLTTFKEEWLHQIIEIYYDMDHHLISLDEGFYRIKEIINYKD